MSSSKEQAGSTWAKWDLHVHTPDSIVQNYGGKEAWDAFLDDLESLPSDIKAIGINDYIFLDGYRRVLKEREQGRIQNLDLVLPVVELRIDKFGGTSSDWSRINLHVIFSERVDPDQIQYQFISALGAHYQLSPLAAGLSSDSSTWTATPTRESLAELGSKIIHAAPPEKQNDYGTPLLEGFNNWCVPMGRVQEALQNTAFVGQHLVAIGKTEWADLKWNDQSIAEKRNVINQCALVFTASKDVAGFEQSRAKLSQQSVNSRLVDCSDAHDFSSVTSKDRLGNCNTWIRADRSFEGLRQSVIEYDSRIVVSEFAPLPPALSIDGAEISLNPITHRVSESGDGRFCFAGEHSFRFSPYLTCIIGGRGSGKSSLLNLVGMAISGAEESDTFKLSDLRPRPESIDDVVAVRGTCDPETIDFIPQNQVERFALDDDSRTKALLQRLGKQDRNGRLSKARLDILQSVDLVESAISFLDQLDSLDKDLRSLKASLATQGSLLRSVTDPEYQRVTEGLAQTTKDLEVLRASKAEHDNLISTLVAAYEKYANLYSARRDSKTAENPYARAMHYVLDDLRIVLKRAEAAPLLANGAASAEALSTSTTELESALRSFLAERGLTEENLEDVTLAASRHAELEAQIEDADANRSTILSHLSSAEVDTSALVDGYLSALQDLIQPANEQLAATHADARPITLEARVKYERVREGVASYLSDRYTVGDRAASAAMVLTLLPSFDSATSRTAESIKQSASQANNSHGANLFELLESPYELNRLQFEIARRCLDVERISSVDILYDGRSLAETSFGQRCAATLVVLLLLGNGPVIVDEPEAHLDSRLIANYLVDLIKGVKLKRQVIFATHNANLVVNADADVIVELSVDDAGTSWAKAFTIESIDDRASLLALEGGEEAFHRREARYGFNASSAGV